jgi:hypothetical protein
MGNNSSGNNSTSYNSVLFKQLDLKHGTVGKQSLTESVAQSKNVSSNTYNSTACYIKNTDKIDPLSVTSETIGGISKQYNTGVTNVNNLIVKNECNLIPKGIIIMWANKDIPAGWIECDGKNNCTPDLRGRSILGFDSSNTLNRLNQSGGEISHKLNINEMPLHSHNFNTGSNPVSFVTDVDGFGKEYTIGQSTIVDAKQAYSYSHINGLPEGQTLPHNNMPPYTVLRYIMKI